MFLVPLLVKQGEKLLVAGVDVVSRLSQFEEVCFMCTMTIFCTGKRSRQYWYGVGWGWGHLNFPAGYAFVFPVLVV